MGIETFHKDHWVKIDPSRLKAYDALFKLPDPALRTLLAPLKLPQGGTALDFGCGPGFVAAGMARFMGPQGRVIGVDVNKEFVQRAKKVAEEQKVAGRVTVHHVTDEKIPIPDESVDRVLCKNVLEYVPSALSTLKELARVMKPHARLLVLDSDWSFLLLHPWTPSETTEVFSAAAPAFKEPLIGRKLKGLMEQAGFVDVVVEVRANVDSTGQLRAVAQNMLDYGLQFNNLTASTAAELRVKIDNAIETGEFLAVLPQFVVTGVKPSPGDLGKLKGGKAKL